MCVYSSSTATWYNQRLYTADVLAVFRRPFQEPQRLELFNTNRLPTDPYDILYALPLGMFDSLTCKVRDGVVQVVGARERVGVVVGDMIAV